MDTISHGLWAFLLFRNNKRIILFILGSTFLDLPFILGYFYHKFFIGGSGIPEYFDMIKIPIVHFVGTFLHSIIIWSVILVIVYVIYKPLLFFMWGWLLHLSIDVLTHHSDALPIFWPLSNRIYSGIISYWEPKYYGLEFLLTDLTLLTGVLLIVFLRPKQKS